MDKIPAPETHSVNSVHSVESPLFQVGETVYSSIAPDERGIVLIVCQTSTGYFYDVAWASDHTKSASHKAIELSREPLYHQPTR